MIVFTRLFIKTFHVLNEQKQLKTEICEHQNSLFKTQNKIATKKKFEIANTVVSEDMLKANCPGKRRGKNVGIIVSGKSSLSEMILSGTKRFKLVKWPL